MSACRFISALFMLCLTGPVLAQEDDYEGGIIGTGIVGTITHLGSIYVNGQHILIDETLEVSGALTPMTASELRPGHIVAVTAHPQAADWRARDIRQVLSLVGPVDAVYETSFTVLGTRVEPDALSDIPGVGEWVAVSGLWQGPVLRASRLDSVAETQRQARISGTYFGTDTEGRDVIGGTAVTGLKTRHLQPGDLVRIFGQPVSGGIEAARLERHLFNEAVRLIQVEGYFSEPRPSGLYTVLGSGLIAYTNQPEMINPERKVVLCGEGSQFGIQTSGTGNAQELQQLQERLNCKP